MRKTPKANSNAPTTIFLLGCIAILTVIVVAGWIGMRQERYRDRIAVMEQG